MYLSIHGLSTSRTTCIPRRGASQHGPGGLRKGSDPNLGSPPVPPSLACCGRGRGDPGSREPDSWETQGLARTPRTAARRPLTPAPDHLSPSPLGPAHPLKGRLKSVVLYLHCNFFTGFLNNCQGRKSLPLMLNCLIISLLHQLEERDLDHF